MLAHRVIHRLLDENPGDFTADKKLDIRLSKSCGKL
jgi:hypothetical protein